MNKEIEKIKRYDMTRKNCYYLRKYLINDNNNHPFVIVIPGGGYENVWSYTEGVPIAKELNKLGYNAFVLYYRVKELAKYPNPLCDLVKAVKYCFKNKDKLHLTNKYLIMGSSAGGHLACMYGRSDIGYKYYNLVKPSGIILNYPVITLGQYTHEGTKKYILGNDKSLELENLLSNELHITSDYPKTFIWCGDKDSDVDPINTKMFHEALDKKHVENRCVIYKDVIHGVGLGENTNAFGWINTAIDYFNN